MSSPRKLNAVQTRVLDLLHDAPKPLSAYELIDALAAEKRLAPPTVYRALQKLMDEGLAHRVESQNAYVACRHMGPTHSSAFMICRACGGAREFSAAALESFLGQVARKSFFVAEAVSIEIRGLCAGCRGGAVT